MTSHELLGEVLAAFQCCSGFRRADNEHFRHVLAEVVTDAVYERVFVAYYYHADAMFAGE